MRAMRISAVLLAAALGMSAAVAQPAKSMREQIVGTWDLVIAEITAANGSKTLPFGDKPKGQLIFTADGHFSQVHVSSGLPRIASNNRLGSLRIWWATQASRQTEKNESPCWPIVESSPRTSGYEFRHAASVKKPVTSNGRTS